MPVESNGRLAVRCLLHHLCSTICNIRSHMFPNPDNAVSLLRQWSCDPNRRKTFDAHCYYELPQTDPLRLFEFAPQCQCHPSTMRLRPVDHWYPDYQLISINVV